MHQKEQVIIPQHGTGRKYDDMLSLITQDASHKKLIWQKVTEFRNA